MTISNRTPHVCPLLARTIGLALLACTPAPVISLESTQAARTIPKPALYPETLAYDLKHDRFLAGSFREGGIYALHEDGSVRRVVDDPRLHSVLGIAVDVEHDRIWATNSELGASVRSTPATLKRLASVGVYDLVSGAPVHYVDLAALSPGPHLLNGLALDAAGNAYVTDSFAPVIYKIDVQGHASVLVRDARFGGDGINLNGVVVHPDGYLLVIKKSDGVLYKVPLARPADLAPVRVERRIVGGDGVTLVGKNDLVIIANQTQDAVTNAAFALSSNDGFVTARVRAVRPLGDAYATTAVVRDRNLYVVSSRLNRLIKATAGEKPALREQAVIQPIGVISR